MIFFMVSRAVALLTVAALVAANSHEMVLSKCHGPRLFLCADKTHCVSNSFVCDGFSDCDDGSDELSCVPEDAESDLKSNESNLAHNCTSVNEFKCLSSGLCIPSKYRCDGNADCKEDASDELNCNNTASQSDHDVHEGQDDSRGQHQTNRKSEKKPSYSNGETEDNSKYGSESRDSDIEMSHQYNGPPSYHREASYNRGRGDNNRHDGNFNGNRDFDRHTNTHYYSNTNREEIYYNRGAGYDGQADHNMESRPMSPTRLSDLPTRSDSHSHDMSEHVTESEVHVDNDDDEAHTKVVSGLTLLQLLSLAVFLVLLSSISLCVFCLCCSSSPKKDALSLYFRNPRLASSSFTKFDNVDDDEELKNVVVNDTKKNEEELYHRNVPNSVDFFLPRRTHKAKLRRASTNPEIQTSVITTPAMLKRKKNNANSPSSSSSDYSTTTTNNNDDHEYSNEDSNDKVQLIS